MKRSLSYHRTICVFAFVLCWMFAHGNPTNAQSVTWQILPFPQSDWPGPFGQPATTNGNVITLHGQPVRTLQSFSGPLRISYDVSFDARISSDGALQFFLIPPGTPTNQIIPSMALFMGYRSTGVDGLMIYTNKSGSLSPAMTEIPFTLSAQTTYHVTMDFSANGGVGWIVNNQTNFIPSAVKIPYAQYQLEIQSWQPGGPTWTVSNFAVVPEPNTATLVITGFVSMLVLVRRKSMKKLGVDQLRTCVLALAVLCLWTSSTPANAQSVTWQILPFYTDTDWPGSHGSPATTNGNVVSLHGQPVRTVQSFSGGPLRISYDVVLSSRVSTDGNLQFVFVPSGLASNQIHPGLQLAMIYRNSGGSDALAINSLLANGSDSQLWGEVPFSVSAGTTYHNVIDVSASGALTWTINNVTNVIPSNITIPFAQYQLELQGWQPGGPTWTVTNFDVVPEPSVAMLVAASLAGLLIFRTGKRN